jgi:hypothetical protein
MKRPSSARTLIPGMRVGAVCSSCGAEEHSPTDRKAKAVVDERIPNLWSQIRVLLGDPNLQSDPCNAAAAAGCADLMLA